jgi:hypothetical protein
MGKVEREPPMDVQFQSHMKPILRRKCRMCFDLWNHYEIALTLQNALLSVYMCVLIMCIFVFACLYAIEFILEKSILYDSEV